ncbi:MAG: sulfotransferase family 2 domain-containing protein [Pararhodobacter sp.]|nr:sulfotransferase family 2 domain-containing protein [Pararhodobacter sp.]
MTVILEDHKLSYIPVPKVACTSLKVMFFEVENGFGFKPFRTSGKMWWIHRFYPSIPFTDQNIARMEGHRRMAVVRDPVKRLLSCYSNRVLHHKELSRDAAGAALEAADLPCSPDLSTFVRRLPEYCAAVESIWHHAMPMVEYLGRDPQFYTHLYPIKDTGEMQAEVARLTGVSAQLDRLQKGGPKISTDKLSATDLALLKDFYDEDYALYGRYC